MTGQCDPGDGGKVAVRKRWLSYYSVRGLEGISECVMFMYLSNNQSEQKLKLVKACKLSFKPFSLLFSFRGELFTCMGSKHRLLQPINITVNYKL